MEDEVLRDLAIRHFDELVQTDGQLRKVDNDLYTSGALSPSVLRDECKRLGIKTVLNLRNKDEEGFDATEEAHLTEAGLEYRNLPTQMAQAPPEEVVQLIGEQVALAKKPVLLHCRRGLRSAFVAQYLRQPAHSWAGVEQLTADLFMAGQIEERDVIKAKELGFRTVVNLRLAKELSAEALAAEERWCTERGLKYEHHPVGPADLGDADAMDRLTQKLAAVERPALVHCRSATRAKVVSLCMLHTGATKEAAPTIPEGLREMVLRYVEQRRDAVRIDDHILQVDDDVLVTGQLSLAQIAQLPELGFKAVINLRSPDEEGFEKDEQSTVEKLGMQYENIPTEMERIPTAADYDKIRDALARLPKKVLIHCRRGFRSAHAAAALV